MKNEITAGITFEQPGFTLFWEDVKEYLECLSDREIGHIIRMLYAYVSEGKETEMKRSEKLPFVHLRNNILQQEKKYREKKEQNRENGSKGGSTKKTKKKANGSERLKKEATAGDRKATQTQTKTQDNASSSKEVPSNGTLWPGEEEAADGSKANAGASLCNDRYDPCATLTEPYVPPYTEEEHAAFLQFRRTYPKKTNIARAEPLLVHALKSVSLEKILRSVREQWRTDDWQKENGRYIPCAEKWLRDRCWEDEPAVFDDGYRIIGLPLA